MDITEFFNNLISEGELDGFMFPCLVFATLVLVAIFFIILEHMHTKSSLKSQSEDNRQKELDNENLRLKNEQLSL